MSRRPILLDLFCCSGIGAMGYHRAGFDVIGIDVADQPRYPFTFIQADLATEHPDDLVDLWSVGAIHASPPCQAHTTVSNRDRGNRSTSADDNHVDLIPRTLELLAECGKPWVMENVPGARKSMPDPVTVLSGGMFGLGVHRPRLFSASFPISAPPSAPPPEGHIGVYGKLDGRRLWTRADGSELRAARTLDQARDAMGVDWQVTWDELTESIPPSYTKFVGEQLIDHVREVAA